jgi:hypothetical protein
VVEAISLDLKPTSGLPLEPWLLEPIMVVLKLIIGHKPMIQQFFKSSHSNGRKKALHNFFLGIIALFEIPMELE